MELVIRKYRPSDKDSVRRLFRDGIQEHIGPSFYNAMTSPLYVSITMGLFAAGYLLGSILGALVLTGGWVAMVYYVCHEVYACFTRNRLQTDMEDIPGHYLVRPGDYFWVAEATISGTSQIVSIVAVVAQQNGAERYGELCRMIVSSSCRRLGLGSRMAQTVLDFCKEHGFTRLVLETSTTQVAGVALYEKMGFVHVQSHTKTVASDWMMKLSRVKVLLMEKRI